MSPPACRACGSPDVALRGRKPGRFLRRDFEFFTCRACSFLFVEPFSGFEIYDDAYYRGHGPDPYVDYESEYRDWRRSDRRLEFDDLFRLAAERLGTHAKPVAPIPSGISTSLPTSSASPGARSPAPSLSPPLPLRWLDFGCGAGAFLKYLREHGSLLGRPLELTGHDVGSYARLLATADGFRILDPTQLAREPDASCDLISMVEVIEHLPQPLEPLRLAARLLKPGGLLLLTTGNLDSPVARRQGIHYRYCAPEIHVSLFNPRCLATLYRQAGLEPCQVRYHGAVQFKVLKTLRHRPALRPLARFGLRLPPVVRLVDWLYGVSAMPCAFKPPPPA
jgi:SAM-dependent methyltransferase